MNDRWSLQKEEKKIEKETETETDGAHLVRVQDMFICAPDPP